MAPDRITQLRCCLHGVHPVPSKGMTLVEVMAALSILGGAITLVLLVQVRCLHHTNTLDRELIARQLAGELITTWRLRNDDITISSQGNVEGMDGWSWRRAAQRVDDMKGAEMMQVTMEMIYHDPVENKVPWIRPYTWLVRERAE